VHKGSVVFAIAMYVLNDHQNFGSSGDIQCIRLHWRLDYVLAGENFVRCLK